MTSELVESTVLERVEISRDHLNLTARFPSRVATRTAMLHAIRPSPIPAVRSFRAGRGAALPWTLLVQEVSGRDPLERHALEEHRLVGFRTGLAPRPLLLCLLVSIWTRVVLTGWTPVRTSASSSSTLLPDHRPLPFARTSSTSRREHSQHLRSHRPREKRLGEPVFRPFAFGVRSVFG